jgi:hypothetical protein
LYSSSGIAKVKIAVQTVFQGFHFDFSQIHATL